MPEVYDRVGGEFTVNTTTAGAQGLTGTVRLASGGFVVGIADAGTSTFGQPLLKIQIYDASGARVGGETLIDGVLIELDQGFGTARTTRLQYSQQIEFQRYDESGAPVGAPVTLSPVPAAVSTQAVEGPQLTVLPSGDMLVTWTQVTYIQSSQFYDVYAQMFAPSGAPLGSAFRLSTDTIGDQQLPVVATLAGGGFVAVWEDNSGQLGEEGWGLKAQIFDPAGGRVGPEFRVNGKTDGGQQGATVTALAGGGFVAAWTDYDGDSSSTAVRAQLFTDAGVKVGPEFLVHTITDGMQVRVSLDALSSGGFVAAWGHWDQGGPDPSGFSVEAQVFDATASRVGDQFQVNTVTELDQDYPSVIGLASGGFAIVWQDQMASNTTLQTDVKAQLFAPPAGPTPVAHVDHAGNDGDESVTGGAGNDRLAGAGGNDVLDGGGGHDFLNGGAGSNTANGGDGIDTLVVDYGDVATPVVSTALTPNGGGGFDGSISTSDRNVTFSSIERFWITTGSGNDEVRTGAGDDIVSLGAGDDFAYLGGGDDQLDGGDGIDGFSADYSSSLADVVADLRLPLLPADRFRNFEYVGTLRTGSGADVVFTREVARDEKIFTNGGDDFISVENGADEVEGGSGFDTLFVNYIDATGPVVSGAPSGTLADGYTGTVTSAGRSVAYSGIERLQLVGGAFNDDLRGGAGIDTFNGNGGADTMTGGNGNDIYFVENAGDVVVELAGEGTDEIRTFLAVQNLASTNVENLRAMSGIDHEFRGNEGNNVVTGGAGRDVVYLQQGGNDRVSGLAGNDTFFYGATFTAADAVSGGDGIDGLILQGAYTLTLGTGSTANVTGVETISLAPGHFTDWGDTAGNFYDYSFTTLNGNVAAGAVLKFNGFYLRAGEDFTFNGTAETDGKFILLGGQGVDNLTGGNGNDIFAFGPDGRFGSTDVANGGAGYDSVYLRGDYALDFTAASFGTMTSIESITLGSAAEIEYTAGGDGELDYDLVWDDAMLANDGLITVNGSGLGVNETMAFDATDEAGGAFRMFAGAAADTLTGGGGGDLLYGGRGGDTLRGNGGADTYRYQATVESTTGAGNYDNIVGFTHAVDRIDLSVIDANATTAGNDTFAFIGAATFSAAGPLSAGELRAFQSDPATNLWEVHGDTDGNGLADFVLVVTVDPLQSLTVSDFLL
ncbi:MAG TPA: calcium-binding protein [Allosphingosinicella sp.]|jgi:Ca2+-binding RTX toxin-like protein